MSEHRICEPADILLVEDNSGDVRLTREAFKEGQIQNTLHVVTDGVEAMDFLAQRADYADAPLPDIVLLDLNLPRKNGDEVLEDIRDDPSLRHIPVIVLTSSQAEEDVVKSYELCANAYLTKPVDPDKFTEVVRTFEEFWLSIVRLPTDEKRE
jgi:CheY-like chemotaxis protein